MSNIAHNLMEKIRPLVGSKCWNYCVLWKLSDDQRFLEWVDCCCAGTDHQSTIETGSEFQFPCRDVMYQHQRTKSCDIISQLPSTIPLDSGSTYAQTLISNQPRWLNFTNNQNSNLLEEIGTRVLIPVTGGLIELFATRQVSEDQNVTDFAITQYNVALEQEAAMNPNIMDSGFNVFNETLQPKPSNDQNNIHFQSTGLTPALDNLNMAYNMSDDLFGRLCNSPMAFSGYTMDNKPKSDILFESHPFVSSSENGIHQEMDPMMQNHMMGSDAGVLMQGTNDKDSNKNENGRADSVSDCSDQVDDEDDGRYRRRNGSKGPQSKNLMAERKRRKKLNERLYTLRSLVPKISKLDRAAILGDAIDFMKDLQKEAKELQDELEENSDIDDDQEAGKNLCSVITGVPMDPKPENENGSKQDNKLAEDKTQQMEVQVEVDQIDANKFFVQVFCEHKAGGFVRLMEALDSLGFDVTNANVTSNLGLVSNVFKVENKDSEMAQAEHVTDSLLELIRNPSRAWSDMTAASEISDNGPSSGSSHQQQQQQLHNHHMNSHHHLLHHFHG